MSNDINLFSSIHDLKHKQNVIVGDGFTLEVKGEGTVLLDVKVNGNEIKQCKLLNVLYVPELSYNLLSVSKAVNAGKVVEFDNDGCNIKDERGRVLASAKRVGNLFYLNNIEKPPRKHEMNAAEQTWHSRYGHINIDRLNHLRKENMVDGMNYSTSQKEKTICKPCIDGKHHRTKFPKGCATRASDVLELIHTDVCGKVGTQSLSGCEYFLTFTDDKSRYTWCYVIKHKSDVFKKFIEWKMMVENVSGKVVKILRSDNGGEYTSHALEEYLKKNGIVHQFTVSKNPEQNGVAERNNRTLVEMVRSMLSESKLGKCYWAEALMTAVYLKNRSPTVSNENKTPYELWTGRIPNVSHLRTFGCICYSHIPRDERQKLDPKAREAIFLGYGTETKGYRLCDINTKKIFLSRDVIFDEQKFIDCNTDKRTEDSKNKQTIELIEEHSDEPEDALEDHIKETDFKEQPTYVDETQHLTDEVTLPRPKRNRKAPQYYGEWANISETIKEPKTYKEAIESNESDEWKSAMEEEIKSLEENQVWTLTQLPDDRKTIGCKWVFKCKYNSDGVLERYKARLVAQGYNQQYGIDYQDTFSPVARFESIRLIISLAAINKLKLHQMDVTTAFLNGALKEDIFMKQPEGYKVKGKEMLVCKLNRSLYGLKQSAKCWNEELDSHLKSLGFKQSISDQCIYIKSDGNDILVVAVYVDDIIVGGQCKKHIDEIKYKLSLKFSIKDMGELHHFLGVKIIQSEDGIWIGQPSFIEDLLMKFDMKDCKPVDTPADPSIKLKKLFSNDDKVDREKYQSAIGCLIYLSTRTRPDITYAVGAVAKYAEQPGKQHWTAVKRIFRYLKGTITLGIKYSSTSKDELIGYSDADWAGDVDDRKSTSGYAFELGSIITWRSKKQASTALSTAEAEYLALASCIQEALWLKKLLSDLTNKVEKSIDIYEDNQSTISMAKNQHSHGRSKHIDIKYHFIKEHCVDGCIQLIYCPTEEMKADMFTKPLYSTQFKKLRALIGMATKGEC